MYFPQEDIFASLYLRKHFDLFRYGKDDFTIKFDKKEYINVSGESDIQSLIQPLQICIKILRYICFEMEKLMFKYRVSL